jgi:hypothetical protein
VWKTDPKDKYIKPNMIIYKLLCRTCGIYMWNYSMELGVGGKGKEDDRINNIKTLYLCRWRI